MEMMKKIGLTIIVMVLAMFMVIPAMAATPIPIPKIGEDGYDNGGGMLYITVACGHNIFSKDVSIYRANEADPFFSKIFFINGDRVAKETFDMMPKIDGAMNITLGLGGGWDINNLAPGTYAVMLKDGNNGQPEYAIVAIYHGGTSYIRFIGHAVSFDNVCVGSIKIINATYGAEQCKPIYTYLGDYSFDGSIYTFVGTNLADYDVTFSFVGVIEHPAGTHQEFVPEVNHTECTPASHTEYQISTYSVITLGVDAYTEYFGDYDKIDGHYNFVGIDKADYDVTFKYVAPDTGSYYVHNTNCVDHDWSWSSMQWVCVEYKVKCTNHAEHGKGWHTQTSRCTDSYINHKGDYTQDGDHYNYVGTNNGDYVVNTHTKPGHTHHDAIPPVLDWVITTPFENGTCPYTLACVTPTPIVGDTKCEQITIQDPDVCIVVVNNPAHYITVVDTQPWTEYLGNYVQDGDHFVYNVNGIYIVGITTNVGHITTYPCKMDDVTAAVQSAVDQGYASFIFNNTMSGLYSTDGKLLATIPDPAPGTPKSVIIIYNTGCGSGDKSINAVEYETINLV